MCGSQQDQWTAPTSALCWERLGVEKDAAMAVLREIIAKAIRRKPNESRSVKSEMDDVAEAAAVVKRGLIGELPRMRCAGRTDVSDLRVAVNEVTPVSESCYAVASSLVERGGAGFAYSPDAWAGVWMPVEGTRTYQGR